MPRPSAPNGLTTGGVVAIARRLSPAEVGAMTDALLAGGIGAFELTLNDPEDVSRQGGRLRTEPADR